MTDREYHPELPDHPIIWIGADVCTATDYGRHDYWHDWKVEAYTKTQVVLRSKSRPEMTDRWRVDGLQDGRDGIRYGYHKGGHGRGDMSTTLRGADDPVVLKDKLVRLYEGAISRLERQLSLRDQARNYNVPVDLMRGRLGNAHAELHKIMRDFHALADRLPAEKEED